MHPGLSRSLLQLTDDRCLSGTRRAGDDEPSPVVSFFREKRPESEIRTESHLTLPKIRPVNLLDVIRTLETGKSGTRSSYPLFCVRDDSKGRRSRLFSVKLQEVTRWKPLVGSVPRYTVLLNYKLSTMEKNRWLAQKLVLHGGMKKRRPLRKADATRRLPHCARRRVGGRHERLGLAAGVRRPRLRWWGALSQVCARGRRQ
jgi:hypothetical protein